MSLELSCRKVGDVAVVDLTGRITLGEEASKFREAIRVLVARGERKLLLNLAQVSYLDSSGLGELVSAYTTLRSQGGELKLLHLGRRIRDILQITKLCTVFEVYEDEAEAVRSFYTR